MTPPPMMMTMAMMSIRRARHFSRSVPRAAVHPRSCIRLTLDRTSRSCCNGRIVDVVVVVVDAVFHGSDVRCFERRTTSSTASSATDVAHDRRCNSCIVVVSAAAAAADNDDAESTPKGAYRRTGLIVPASIGGGCEGGNNESSLSMWKLTRWEQCGGGIRRIGRGGLHPIGKRRRHYCRYRRYCRLPSSGLPPPMLQVVHGASRSRRCTSSSSSTARRR